MDRLAPEISGWSAEDISDRGLRGDAPEECKPSPSTPDGLGAGNSTTAYTECYA
jgi:hypothetical protein